ncbi:MAG: hypothetical protein JWO02_878, partial [Solirubrobacterales bacterium]|nr:hypothetical protein [Solirubrobacterales bacterium]
MAPAAAPPPIRRLMLMGLWVVLGLAGAVPAAAFWHASGTGAGSAAAATMPSGQQPTGTASGQSVTVTWTQSTFGGVRLGTVAGGGYTVARYPQGSSSAAAIGASCATTITGTGASLQCVETGVPYGGWQYSVTPVLGGSFTGPESAHSAVVSVATAAPSLTAATATNPGAGQSTGGVQLTWASVTGATGYNVYRRTSSGAFDFASAVNGGTPLGVVTSYTDTSVALTGGTTYVYVVRAVAGTPAVESASSAALSATVIARPAAPAGTVSAVAAPAARIDVSWSTVSGAVGYNVYRRTTAGSFNYASPLNGGTPAASATYADTTGTNGTSYIYVVRAVILGAGGAQVESVSSSESAAATSDSVAPPAPTAVSVTSGGNVLAATACTVASGTRYINNAGKSAVGVAATIAAPEPGETVVFSATTSGSTPVTATVAATGTSVSATLNLSSLLDGPVTLTARTMDLAGNLSATPVLTNAVIKDVVAGALSGVSYNDRALLAVDQILGTSECGAPIVAVQTAGGSTTYTSAAVGAGGTFTLNVSAQALSAYSYNVTATDLAGN